MRLRERWFPWLTVGIALFWVLATHQVVPRIEEVNSARLCGMLMLGGMGLPDEGQTHPDDVSGTQPAPPAAGLPLFGLFSRAFPQPAPPNSQASRARMIRLQRATGVVEVVIRVWRRTMYATAALLTLIAIVARFTHRKRTP